MQHDGVERSAVPGGWVVTNTVQGDEGVRWVSFTFFPDLEPELDEDASGSWPRKPSISSRTTRLRRRVG